MATVGMAHGSWRELFSATRFQRGLRALMSHLGSNVAFGTAFELLTVILPPAGTPKRFVGVTAAA